MKSVFALIKFSALFAVSFASVLPILPATTLIRSPQHDSAIIQSERVGGSFSYSTIEGHAYQAISPVITNVYRPIGVSYEYRTYPFLPAAAYPYPLYVQQPFYTQVAPSGLEFLPAQPEKPEEGSSQQDESQQSEQQEQSDEPTPANDSPQNDEDTVAVDTA